MYTIHATRKLLDGLHERPEEPVTDPSTVLGNWYATWVEWDPEAVLLVNEATRLPVLVDLAPTSTLLSRIADQVAAVLVALDVAGDVASSEHVEMRSAWWAKTANRSVVGSLNEFGFLAGVRQQAADPPGSLDLVELSARLAHTPCGPLYKSHSFPDLELHAHIAAHTTIT